MPFGFFEEEDESAYTGDYQHVKKKRDFSLETMPYDNGQEFVTKQREVPNENSQI